MSSQSTFNQPKSVATSTASPWRSIGPWMVLVICLYILFLVFRAVTAPSDFASYFGTPLIDPKDVAFVFVYAIRSFFLGVYGLALLATRQYRALMWYAFVGSLMPLGDALLVLSAGGPTATIARHIGIIVFLLVTAFFMRRWVKIAGV